MSKKKKKDEAAGPSPEARLLNELTKVRATVKVARNAVELVIADLAELTKEADDFAGTAEAVGEIGIDLLDVWNAFDAAIQKLEEADG